jgi:hypothetical protein
VKSEQGNPRSAAGDIVTAEEAILDLRSSTCRCGATKSRMQSLCRRCYGRLPRRLQHALYDLVGNGYEEAYEAALVHLGLGVAAPPASKDP